MASIVTSFSVVRYLPGLPAGREDFGVHITVDIGPFAVLLGQDDTDKEDDRGTAGKDADDVGAPVISLIKRSCGSLLRAWRQISRGRR
jgi:hypothetical protein